MPVENDYTSGTIGHITTYVESLKATRQTYSSTRVVNKGLDTSINQRHKKVYSYTPQAARLIQTSTSSVTTINEDEFFTFSEEKYFGKFEASSTIGPTVWTPTRKFIADILIIGIPGGGSGGRAGYAGEQGEPSSLAQFSSRNPYALAGAGPGGTGGNSGLPGYFGYGINNGTATDWPWSILYIQSASFLSGTHYNIIIPSASCYGTGGMPAYWTNIYGDDAANSRNIVGASWSSATGVAPSNPATEKIVSIGPYVVNGGTVNGGISEGEGMLAGDCIISSYGFYSSGSYVPAQSYFMPWQVHPGVKLTRHLVDIQLPFSYPSYGEISTDVRWFNTTNYNLRTYNAPDGDATSNPDVFSPLPLSSNTADGIHHYTTMSHNYYTSLCKTTQVQAIPGCGGYPGYCWDLQYVQPYSSKPMYMGYSTVGDDPEKYNIFWNTTIPSFTDDVIMGGFGNDGNSMTNNGVAGAVSGSSDLTYLRQPAVSDGKYNFIFKLATGEYTKYVNGSPAAIAAGLILPFSGSGSKSTADIMLMSKPISPIMPGAGGKGGYGGCGGQGGFAYVTQTSGTTPLIFEAGGAYGPYGLPDHTDETTIANAAAICDSYSYGVTFTSIKSYVSYSLGCPGEPCPATKYYCAGQDGDIGTEGSVYIMNIRPS